MNDNLCPHSVNNISESTYVCEQCGKTIRRNETCTDDDVTQATSLSAQSSITPYAHMPNTDAFSPQVYNPQHVKNSDDDETQNAPSGVVLLPLPPGQGQFSPSQSTVPTAQGAPQVANVPYTQGAPHLQGASQIANVPYTQGANNMKYSSHTIQKPGGARGVQRIEQQIQPSQSNMQYVPPASSRWFSTHTSNKFPPSGGHGIRYYLGRIIPIHSVVGMSTLVFVLVTAVLVPLFLFLSAHKNTPTTGNTPPKGGQQQTSPLLPQLLAMGSQVPGSTITIQGSHFNPGGTIILSVDAMPLPSGVAPPKKTAFLPGFALVFTHVKLSSVVPTTTVQKDGTFEENFVIPLSWLPDSHHMIIASEDGISTHTLATASLNLVIQVAQKISALQIPCILTDEANLSFSGLQGHDDPVAQPLSLKNCGRKGGWTAHIEKNISANWLHINLSKGNLQPQEAQSISATTTLANLQPGVYSGVIIFTLATVHAQVHVTLYVMSPTVCVQTTPALLVLSSEHPQSGLITQPFTVQNCGNAGTWFAIATTDDNANWLSVDMPVGSLNAGAHQSVVVRANAANLSAGTYMGRIYIFLGATINSQGNPIVAMSQIRVTLHLLSSFQLTKTHLTFSKTLLQRDPAPQSIALTNTGYSAHWAAAVEIARGGNWFTLDKNSGILTPGAMQTLVVTPGSANLQAGLYTGQIIFQSEVSIFAVNITLNITPNVSPDCLSVPSSLKLIYNEPDVAATATAGANGTPIVALPTIVTSPISLTNCGGTGRWSTHILTPSGEGSWLSVDPSTDILSASHSEVVNVSANLCPKDPGTPSCSYDSYGDRSGGLPGGNHNGKITFTLGNSHKTVTVTFEVFLIHIT